MDIIGMVLKMYHLDFPAVFGHKHKHIPVKRIVMGHLLHNLEQTAIPTTHICHTWDIVEVLQAGYCQHRPSSFSTNF